MKKQRRRRRFYVALAVMVLLLCGLIVGIAEGVLRYQRGHVLDRQILRIEEQLDDEQPVEPLTEVELRENVVRSNAVYPAEQFPDGQLGRVIHRPYLGHRQTPEVQSNSLGYRGPEFEIDKPAGVFRILVYGGSFVYGTGAENDDVTIPGHLQRMLETSGQSGRTIEVINCGERNYCSTQEVVYLLIEGVLLSPDLVIFVDGVNDTAWGYSNLPAGYDGDFHERNHRLRDEPLKHLYTVHELDHLKRERAALSSWQSSLLLTRVRRLFSPDIGNEKLNDDAGALDFNPPHLELVRGFRQPQEYAWRYLLNMRSVRALGNEFGFQSLFFIQPVPVVGKPLNTMEQQRLEQIREQNRWLHHELAYWEDHYNTFADTLLASAADVDGGVVDLRYIFRDHPEALYIDDCHLRGIGYEYVAREIHRALQDRQLLPD